MGDAVSIFDAKVSPDGTKMACVDAEGCLSILGIEDKRISDIPKQQFLKRDYYPLMTDPEGYALDEQTGITPDLLYPQLMVDAEADECDESIQRLMPGNDLLPMKLSNGEMVSDETWKSSANVAHGFSVSLSLPIPGSRDRSSAHCRHRYSREPTETWR